MKYLSMSGVLGSGWTSLHKHSASLVRQVSAALMADTRGR